MDGEKLKLQIGSNIANYRKGAGLTQAGLAEKLNYSDKAVSKWERGESMTGEQFEACMEGKEIKDSSTTSLFDGFEAEELPAEETEENTEE